MEDKKHGQGISLAENGYCDVGYDNSIRERAQLLEQTTAEIIAFQKRKPGFFGSCPSCGGDDGFINVHRDYFVVCHRHRHYWPVCANLFSGWMLTDQTDWALASKLLASYNRVQPAGVER